MKKPTHYECAYYARQVYIKGGGVALPDWEIKETYYPERSHAGFSLIQSATRGAAYAAITFSFFGGPAGPVAVGALITKLGATAVQAVTKDRAWLLRQHSIDNIIIFFSQKNDLPNTYSIMQQWPCLSDILTISKSQARAFLYSLRPFPDDAPGVRNMFNENRMNELQSQRLPGYEVIQHIGNIPDWATVEIKALKTSPSMTVRPSEISENKNENNTSPNNNQFGNVIFSPSPLTTAGIFSRNTQGVNTESQQQTNTIPVANDI